MGNEDSQVPSPLPAIAFHILISLAMRDRHGYGIMQEVADRTEGTVQIQAGSLYATIRRLLGDGLIQEAVERPDPENHDERRRYYHLTKQGRAVALAEVERLASLVRQARASGLVLRTK